MGSTPPPPLPSTEELPPDSLRCMAAALVTHTPLNDRARASLEQAFPGVGELRWVCRLAGARKAPPAASCQRQWLLCNVPLPCRPPCHCHTEARCAVHPAPSLRRSARPPPPSPPLPHRLVLANGESEILECFSLMQDGVPSAEPLVCACAMPPRGGSAAYECMQRGEVVEVGQDAPERCVGMLVGEWVWLAAVVVAGGWQTVGAQCACWLEQGGVHKVGRDCARSPSSNLKMLPDRNAASGC